MFCGECGAKNNSEDRFCSECGAPLVQEENKTNTNSSIVKKPRQPMSKRNKIIVGLVIIVIAILGVLYKIGSDITNPKTIANNYIKATVNQDGDKLYKYLEIEGDDTFISKDIFKELLKNSNTDSKKVENYKITEVQYSDEKLTATVKFTYTVEGSTSEKTSSVNLSKQKNKKFLIFDNWKVKDTSISSVTVENYKIKVTKGSKVTFAGVELTDKYLDKDDSTTKLDVYKLPVVFKSKTTIKTVLANGLEIEETVTPSTYAHTVDLDEDNLTAANKEKVISKIKESLATIYTSAIAKKPFSEIKSNFEYNQLDLKDLETSYTDFLSSLESSTNTLTSITFKDISIYDLSLDEDGNIKVKVKANFDYTVSYTNFSNEAATHDDTDYYYITAVLNYNNGSYYLVNINNLKTYFSRY
mgnify:CR=1 FL=1